MSLPALLLAIVRVGRLLAQKLAECGVQREVGLQPPEAHRRPVRQHLLVESGPGIGHRRPQAPAQTTYGVTLSTAGPLYRKRNVQLDSVDEGSERATWKAP